MLPGTHAVVLTVPDEASLWRLEHQLRQAKVSFCAIIESDEPYAGQLLAIGVVPRRKEELKRHLSSLPLLR